MPGLNRIKLSLFIDRKNLINVNITHSMCCTILNLYRYARTTLSPGEQEDHPNPVDTAASKPDMAYVVVVYWGLRWNHQNHFHIPHELGWNYNCTWLWQSEVSSLLRLGDCCLLNGVVNSAVGEKIHHHNLLDLHKLQ